MNLSFEFKNSQSLSIGVPNIKQSLLKDARLKITTPENKKGIRTNVSYAFSSLK